MKDLYLRFESQAEMFQVCAMLEWVIEVPDQSPRLCAGNHQYSICEVGQIPGRIGWHVNVRVTDTDWNYSGLVPYIVYPTQPVCMWA